MKLINLKLLQFAAIFSLGLAIVDVGAVDRATHGRLWKELKSTYSKTFGKIKNYYKSGKFTNSKLAKDNDFKKTWTSLNEKIKKSLEKDSPISDLAQNVFDTNNEFIDSVIAIATEENRADLYDSKPDYKTLLEKIEQLYLTMNNYEMQLRKTKEEESYQPKQLDADLLYDYASIILLAMKKAKNDLQKAIDKAETAAQASKKTPRRLQVKED